MLRFLSRFRGSRAMLHSSTSRGGVTEFSVYSEQKEPRDAGEGRPEEQVGRRAGVSVDLQCLLGLLTPHDGD